MALSQQFQIPDIIGRFLNARGITAEFVNDFLNPKLNSLLPDPAHLLDMDAAVVRIMQAISTNEKIAIFEKSATPNVSSGAFTLPSLHKLGTLFYNDGTNYTEVERVSNKQIRLLRQTPLTKPSVARPVYVQTSATAIQMYPTTGLGNVTVNYIAKPNEVEWTYTDVGGTALYNATNVSNFELHGSEETKLVVNILALAGVVIKDPNVYQIAANEEIKTIQQEKQ